MDAEGPGDAEALDDGVQRNVDNGAAGTAAGEDDAVREAAATEEVLGWGDGYCLRRS